MIYGIRQRKRPLAVTSLSLFFAACGADSGTDGSRPAWNDVDVIRENTELPRMGMNVEFNRSLEDVDWFGRGPFENYSDRKFAAHVGRYSNKVADHYVPYMRPQENGYKNNVRWLSLSDEGDTELLVIANELFRKKTFQYSFLLNRMLRKLVGSTG